MQPLLVAEAGLARGQLGPITLGQGSGTGIAKQQAWIAVLAQGRQKPLGQGLDFQPLEAQLHGPAARGLSAEGLLQGREGLGLGRAEIGGQHHVCSGWVLQRQDPRAGGLGRLDSKTTRFQRIGFGKTRQERSGVQRLGLEQLGSASWNPPLFRH